MSSLSPPWSASALSSAIRPWSWPWPPRARSSRPSPCGGRPPIRTAACRRRAAGQIAAYLRYGAPIVVANICYQAVVLANRGFAAAHLDFAAAGKLSLATDMTIRLIAGRRRGARHPAVPGRRAPQGDGGGRKPGAAQVSRNSAVHPRRADLALPRLYGRPARLRRFGRAGEIPRHIRAAEPRSRPASPCSASASSASTRSRSSEHRTGLYSGRGPRDGGARSRPDLVRALSEERHEFGGRSIPRASPPDFS